MHYNTVQNLAKAGEVSIKALDAGQRNRLPVLILLLGWFLCAFVGVMWGKLGEKFDSLLVDERITT